jgi:hypothetical protein
VCYALIEQPFRQRIVQPRFTVLTGATMAVAISACGLLVSNNDGFPARISPQAEALSGLERMWYWECQRVPKLEGLAEGYCNFGLTWASAHTKAFLWGDSHAEHMAPLIEAATADLPIAFLLYTKCPASLGGHVRRVWDEQPRYVSECADRRRRAIALLRSDPEIKLVIFSASWGTLSRQVSQDGELAGDPSGPELVRSGLDELIDQTAMPGRRFIIIADVPRLPRDPIPCALAAEAGLVRRQCSEQGVSTADFWAFHGDVYRELDSIAARKDVSIVFPGKSLCSGARCQLYLDGEFLYRDNGHIRRNLAERTKRDLSDLIGLTTILRGASEFPATR